MRTRWIVGAALAMAIATAAVVVGAPGRGSLRFTDGTPADLRAVAEAAWDRFRTAVPGCDGRLDAPTVAVAWDLADRARYEPGPALVLIRAPGTAPNLEASLLHEFAHHAERRCPPDGPTRARFLDAAGLPPGTPWSGGRPWHRVPAERFAEAVVVHVLGDPPSHVLIHLRPEEVGIAAGWAGRG